MSRPKNTKEQKIVAFWKRVDRRGNNDCWNWIGWIQKLPKGQGGGYGKFSLSKYKTCLPHRFSYELANGPIPKGMLVCHKCDNRACCNPEHLFLGSHKDNTQDAVKKGHMPSGEKAPMAKLTDVQFNEIERRYTPWHGVGSLAKEFGIDPKYVWAIGHGKARISQNRCCLKNKQA